MSELFLTASSPRGESGGISRVSWQLPATLTAAPLMSIAALMRGCYGGDKEGRSLPLLMRAHVATIGCALAEALRAALLLVDVGGEGSAGRLFCGPTLL